MEHCTSETAVETVRKMPLNIGATITAHHLFLTVTDWDGDSTGLSWCKPAAKTYRDRVALLQAAASGNPKFFFGSDSAPHSIAAKSGNSGPQAAGIFTQPIATQVIVDAFIQSHKEGLLNSDRLDQKVLEGFLSEHGKAFYRESTDKEHILLGPSQSVRIPDAIATKDPTVTIAPFRRGQHTRSLHWV